ncbi:unnamed protein product [Didymodactylos carnosus]|uniref:Uncharacterized protein n=1 Tax=Didymodactylos carnosus TaxID=1234261 RepID=A0A814LSG3_9BILA|nr:unnamed protein product [Didymodactylos carnosus]CAF1069038.1 unnamed protein product [Didymodactylos carnosus]CAF3595709.1 unnamed protein product [Didymodactylos carnosus]CAF3836373.1 unnamed protein product [Didymodactylos carnosus]
MSSTVQIKKYGAMIDENIATAGKLKIDLQTILEKQDYALLEHYQHLKAYEPSTVMFGILVMLGHFGRNSQYCHYLTDDVFPINLYCVLVGPSGNKLLVNDEIDVFFDPQGVYDSTTSKTAGDVGLLLQAFDGFRKGKRTKNMPTLAHYAIVAHLFGDVQYEWQMSDEEKQRKQRGSCY